MEKKEIANHEIRTHILTFTSKRAVRGMYYHYAKSAQVEIK